MGGGCSTKRSIAIDKAGTQVNLKGNNEESKDESDNNINQNLSNKSTYFI
jgi:hypothetical protein